MIKFVESRHADLSHKFRNLGAFNNVGSRRPGDWLIFQKVCGVVHNFVISEKLRHIL
ncbi:MAG: hypothetical protein AVDCRST_MAG74-1123 [uncultured Pyrinomonadaceae bacterium]|uniref:Uncharacterized protein n=1 Tax=uncultured Pyrinomonadaceae bacterium TaxID=2283094 RepID=A0A6J4NV41_9BACT|nr:MAG: hypothetical protein AVDCRST_MAG74-1123 [uncultured Pyrinomonadaceae bacterium]